jgi:phosphonate transport system permease protein
MTRRPPLLDSRRKIAGAIAIAGLLAFLWLDAPLAALLPGAGGRALVADFFRAAWSPTFGYQGSFVPEGTPPLWQMALNAARRTVVFAAAAMSLAMLVGLLLSIVATTAWWERASSAGKSSRRGWRSGLVVVARALIIGLRSVHELLWAVLLLSAFGLTPLTAVIAIALPYSGTLAKIFAELLEEAPRDSADALRSLGAGPLQVLTFGLLPRALPDMAAYSLYRFECAVRSSAVLGFFGYETLGLYIRASFENLHYREVWTYLYLLLALVLALEFLSGRLRRNLVR